MVQFKPLLRHARKPSTAVRDSRRIETGPLCVGANEHAALDYSSWWMGVDGFVAPAVLLAVMAALSALRSTYGGSAMSTVHRRGQIDATEDQPRQF